MNEDDKLEKLEEMPSKELHPPRYKKHNHMRYNYKRLRRWIYKQIGRDFNALFSDFKKQEWVPMEYRTLEFLNRRYFDEVQMENDILVVKGYYDFYPLEGSLNDHLYIHPVTNKLSYTPAAKRETWMERNERETKEKCVILGDFHQLAKIKGIWYEIHLKEFQMRDKWDYTKKTYVNVMEMLPPRKPFNENDIQRFFTPIKTKRQISSKELKEHNLKND